MTAGVEPAETDCPGASSISSSSRTDECFSIVQSRQASSNDMRSGAADEEPEAEAIVRVESYAKIIVGVDSKS